MLTLTVVTRRLRRVTVLLVLVLATIVFLCHRHVKGYEAFNEGHAVLIVGYASLLHLSLYGEAPESVQGLFDVGILRVAADGAVELPGFGAAVPPKYIERVRLAMPDNPGSFALDGGVVRSAATGRELVWIEAEGGATPRTDWAYLWFCVANGDRTGIDWLDDLLSNASAQCMQPVSAPAP